MGGRGRGLKAESWKLKGGMEGSRRGYGGGNCVVGGVGVELS